MGGGPLEMEMTMLRSVFMLSAVSMAVALLGTAAHAQSYKFKTIDINEDDQTYLLSDAGRTILGWDIPSSGNPNCTLIQGKTDTQIADPNGTVTFCYNISNGGTVVGYYYTTDNEAGAFTYSNGTFSNFSVAGLPGPLPLAISTSGKYIAGYYYEDGEPYGFVLKNGTKVTTFTIPGMAYIFPDGVNNKGEVSIQAYDQSDNMYCYVGPTSNLVQLNYPGTTYDTLCQGLNNKNQVVGTYTDSTGATDGFAYDPATQDYYTIDYPGAADTTILYITDAETLVGYYQATSGGSAQGMVAKGSIP
jgi:probable HAF family extracellular repeat protein